jgi:hypothetical protein
MNHLSRWSLYPPPKGAATLFSRKWKNAILPRNWRAGQRRLSLEQTQRATHAISLLNIQTPQPLQLPRRLVCTANQWICPVP